MKRNSSNDEVNKKIDDYLENKNSTERILKLSNLPHRELLSLLFINKYSKEGNIENKEILNTYDTKNMDGVEFSMMLSYFIRYKIYNKIERFVEFMHEDTHHNVDYIYELFEIHLTDFENIEHEKATKKALKIK